MSGNSNELLYDKYLDYKNLALEKLNIPGVTIVKTKEEAKACVKILKLLKDR